MMQSLGSRLLLSDLHKDTVERKEQPASRNGGLAAAGRVIWRALGKRITKPRADLMLTIGFTHQPHTHAIEW
jgi:hypothetical protein